MRMRMNGRLPSRCFRRRRPAVSAYTRLSTRFFSRNLNKGDDSSNMAPNGPRGRLEVIMGPMFAGKTSALLERIRVEEKTGKSVLVIKSATDTRYSTDAIVSHDGDNRKCSAVAELKSVPESLIKAADVVAVDEAQFFPDLYRFCRDVADGGQIVIVAGLDGDFKRERFGQLLDIAPLADAVVKLKANCAICGEEAPFTARNVSDDEQTLVGGEETYTPLCRKHYVQNVIAQQQRLARAQNHDDAE
mmetsp:Transcript_12919/g.23445  ORF Transcript_12919/g.23445 Transcript_12919/m.23445 type:complete len:246 (+) Transcript_12919:2-739(+)